MLFDKKCYKGRKYFLNKKTVQRVDYLERFFLETHYFGIGKSNLKLFVLEKKIDYIC